MECVKKEHSRDVYSAIYGNTFVRRSLCQWVPHTHKYRYIRSIYNIVYTY